MSNQLSFGARLKLLMKHGVIFGLTSSLHSALSFILLPLYTNYLSLEEFGNYNMLLVWAGALNTLFGLGASSALGRYYYDEKKAGNEKELVSAAFWISAFGGGLLIVLSFVFVVPISTCYFHDNNMQLPIIICAIANALSYPTTTLTLLLRYKKQSVFYLIFTLISLLLNFCITITLLKLHAGIISPFVGQAVTQILLLAALFWHERKSISLKISKFHYSIIFLFGMQIILNSFLGYVYECSDKMVMKEMLSIEDVGIYSLSNRIGSIFKMLIYMPFVLIWTPLRMEFKNSTDNKRFISKINSYYTIFGCLFIVICMIWGYDVLKALFPQEEYAISLLLYPICLLANLCFGYQSIYDFGIYINNKLYYQSVICILTLIFNVGMNIWLLPIWGVVASAYIFLATYILTDCMLLIISNRFYSLPLALGNMLVSFVMTIATYIVFFIIDAEFTHNILFKIAITILVFVFSWFALFTTTEREHVLAYIKRPSK